MVTQAKPIGTDFPRIAYTVTEASQILRCHRETVLDGLNKGHIKGYRIGAKGQWMITKGMISHLTGVEVEDLPD